MKVERSDMEFNPRNKRMESLVEYLKENPMSVKELAEKIGIDYPSLLKHLKGYTRDIHTKTAMKIDKFFNHTTLS